ncbi:MAG TPA: class I SAM-dependent methyltransferase [Bacteroidia bacterium]|nr:class I SAM-dependent methyltransferase [Bacteroidia bacterium]
MVEKKYTKYRFIKKLYEDSSRINKRGEFLKKNSNRISSIRDILIELSLNDMKKNVIDYGCGSGSFIQKFDKIHNNTACYAVDIVRNKAIAENKNINYQVIYPSQFPKYNVCFDIIFCMNVLYHLDSKLLEDLFQWFKLILKSNGVIYITTKSSNNFPEFNKMVTKINNIEYPISDESSFCSENCFDIVRKSFYENIFSIEQYDIKTQIITKDFEAVYKYMLSNNRYSDIFLIKDEIMNNLKKSTLFIDQYHETILKIKIIK